MDKVNKNLVWSISGLEFGEVKGLEKEKSVPIFWWKTKRRLVAVYSITVLVVCNIQLCPKGFLSYFSAHHILFFFLEF